MASSNHIIGDARVAIRWTVPCSSYNLTLQQPTEQQQIENWVLPMTPHLSLEFHIVLTSVRQLLLRKEFLCSLGTWSTQRSPHLVEVYHRSSLSTNPEERAMKPKCAVASDPVVLDMKLNPWYGCPECWKVAGYVQVDAMDLLGPGTDFMWGSTQPTLPLLYNLYNSLFYTADSLDKDFASEYTGRGSRASKIDVTESHHRQDSGQAPSKL